MTAGAVPKSNLYHGIAARGRWSEMTAGAVPKSDLCHEIAARGRWSPMTSSSHLRVKRCNPRRPGRIPAFAGEVAWHGTW